MATGTFYLRPSADISLEHTVYPDTLTAGYLAISEETSDASSTYICVKTDTSNDITVRRATSEFSMSLDNAAAISKILSATFFFATIADQVSSENEEVKHTCSISIAGQTMFSGLVEVTYSDNMGKDTDDTLTGVDTSLFVSTVNEYLTNGGSIPEITLTVENYAYATGTKNNTVSGITQIYIELECEYKSTGLNIHRKNDGAWVQAQAAYQKVDGAWVEITEDECKTILQSSLCTRESNEI